MVYRKALAWFSCSRATIESIYLWHEKVGPSSSQATEAGKEDVGTVSEILNHRWSHDAAVMTCQWTESIIHLVRGIGAYTVKFEIQLTATASATPLERMPTGNTSGGRAHPRQE